MKKDLKKLVFDAGVALKWYLSDEADEDKALGLLDAYLDRRIKLLAPGLIEYEIANGLLIAQKRGRISKEIVAMAMDGFFDLGIEMRNLAGLHGKVFIYSQEYGRSAYDSSYLALADEEGIGFVTTDKGLYDSLKNDIQWIRLLKEL